MLARGGRRSSTGRGVVDSVVTTVVGGVATTGEAAGGGAGAGRGSGAVDATGLVAAPGRASVVAPNVVAGSTGGGLTSSARTPRPSPRMSAAAATPIAAATCGRAVGTGGVVFSVAWSVIGSRSRSGRLGGGTIPAVSGLGPEVLPGSAPSAADEPGPPSTAASGAALTFSPARQVAERALHREGVREAPLHLERGRGVDERDDGGGRARHRLAEGFRSGAVIARSISSCTVSARRGRSPRMSACIVAPSAQRSVRGSTMFQRPRACSGGMYDGVPSEDPVCVAPTSPARSARRAMPKSSTFTTPSAVTRMFAGLMSR